MRMMLAIAILAVLPRDKDHFPCAKGIEWTYMFEDDKKEQVYTCEGARTIEDVECIVINRADKEDPCLGKEYYGIGEEGIVMYGSSFKDEDPELDFEAPRTILKFAARKGDTWEGQDGDIALKFEYAGEEEIEVPAGKYKACKVICRYRSSLGDSTLTEWYAKGVGMVKSLSVTKMDKDESKVSRVLKQVKKP